MDLGAPYCTTLAMKTVDPPPAVIPLLLAHPDIDVNRKNKDGGRDSLLLG